MLSDYFNTNDVSKMTFKQFKSRWNCNIEIIRHKKTMEEAFVELGGTLKEEKVVKPKYKKYKSSSND
jgi:hypothetical protein